MDQIIKYVHLRIILFLIVFQLSVSNGANILYIEGVPSPSHHVWHKTITYALANKGHNMTVISTDIEDENIENFHYIHFEKAYEMMGESEDLNDLMELTKLSSWDDLMFVFDYCRLACQGCVQSNGYKQLLNYPKDFKFDLIVYDHVLGPCLLTIADRFKDTPIIGATASHVYQFSTDFLNDALIFAFNHHFVLRSYDETTFFSRFNNFLHHLYERLYRYLVFDKQLMHLANLNNDKIVNIWETEKQVKLLLLNTDKALDTSQLLPQNVIPVGGLQAQRTKALPKNLQDIFDRSKKGVILFSLGTNVQSSMLGQERINEFVNAFKSFKEYEILWKASDINSIELPSNVHIFSWLPQNDILADPKTKLFITHSGLLSIQEATIHGVPMIGMPVFVDQYGNIDNLVKKGTAEKLLFDDFNAKRLTYLMIKILNDPKYTKNTKTKAKLFVDQKESPLDRAIWWIEWVIRNPNVDVFDHPGNKMNHFQRLSLDIYLMMILIIFIIYKTIHFSIAKITNLMSVKKNLVECEKKTK